MDNIEVARKASEALAKGDVETFLALHAEDVVIHAPGRSRFAGDFQGREAAVAVFQQQAEMLDGPPEWIPHDVTASEDHVVVLGTQRSRRGGKVLEQRYAVVLHIGGDQIREVWSQPWDLYAEDEFWG